MNFDIYKNLIETDSPINVIWEALKAIWEVKDLSEKSLKEYFKKGEIESNIFENFIHRTYFEIYEVLYNRIQQYSLQNILNQDKYAIIILDALSIREGNLLIPILKEENYEIQEYSYGFSTLPSDTVHFSKTHFQKTSPSTIKKGKNENFYYDHIKKGSIEFDCLNEEQSKKVLLWATYPDELIHKSTIPPDEAFIKTKELLIDILERIESDNFLIMGDHGYVMTQPIWQVGSQDKRFLNAIFKAERYKEKSKLNDKQIEKIEKMPPEFKYVYMDDNYSFVKGRFFWAVRGHSSNIAHGGLSFMECLVPIIKITKKRKQNVYRK
ncbi:MAG: hypothetical protein ACTSRG_19890 [Candidatus Helarchaeota archaeon]